VADQFISEDNSVEIDAYGLLTASASYTFNDWRLTLHLDNLTDEEYESRGFGSSSVIPGAPLAAKVGVEYRF
jgi:outer membrane receptor protein involved in Fe transport